MQDRELYRQILGIAAPWFVERVELKLAEGEVHVHLDHDEVMLEVLPPEKQEKNRATAVIALALSAKGRL